MNTLIRYELDHDIAQDYFRGNLENTNILSNKVLKLINTSSGRFFTILPVNINFKNIYEFQTGGIATGVRDYVKLYIQEKLKIEKNKCCIFDDFTTEYYPGYKDPLFVSNGFFFNEEIYYLVTQTDAPTIIDQCFIASNTIWHSLCLITEINLSLKVDKQLILKELENIISNASLLILGAYDGEGYVCWERN